MEKDYLVTKSNYFIMNSSYDLSLQEQKIVLTLASLVQPTDEEFKPYIFKIAEFMKLVGVEDKSKYSEIPKITKDLMKKVLEIQEGNTLLQVAWLNSARYEKGSGMVILKFSPDLKPYMLQLKEKFTQYQLGNILCMKSKYSPRIYEILKCNEFKKQGYIEIEIDELRRLLKTEGMYHQYQDLKRKVIIHTQKELKKLTDISFYFEEIKTGRKVTSLKFYIKSNEKKLVEADPVIQEVRNIMYAHEFTDKEIKSILKSAENDLDRIKEVYNHFKNKKIPNFVGLMISMVDPKDGFVKPQQTNIIANDQDYDYDEIERRIEEKAWAKIS